MLSTEWIRPPFDIVRLAHVELAVTSLEAARSFYVDLLGLVVTEEVDGTLYLRGLEERLHHSLALRESAMPMLNHAAFRVASPADLEMLEDHYNALGCSPRIVEDVERGQGAALRVHDPLGFPLEFFYEMEHVDCLLQRFDLYRGARCMRADHINFYVPDALAAYEQYRQLGFRCSEYISDDRENRLAAAWMYRKPMVHDVALTTGQGPRLHHFAFATEDRAAITAFCDVLAGRNMETAIERGPGRHGVSNAFFVYLRDPDGHRIELYASDYYTGDPDHEPIRWSASDPRRRTFWGHDVPDTWYDEGSLVAGPDGPPTELVEPILDERLIAAE
jgi:catechol 2,3-dioxygenase